MNRLPLLTAAILMGSTLPQTVAAKKTDDTKRPNILFILTDDLQNNAIAARGRIGVSTPNIDRILANGTTFTNCYTNGAIGGALSMPSRAMLMTGRGVFEVPRDGSVIPESMPTMPETLRKAGYRTFATGKWHSDYESFTRSFSEGENIFFGGMHTYETGGHTAPRLVHYDPEGRYKEQTPFVGEEFSSKMYADATIDFLETTTNDQRPYFAYVAFTSPHDPRNQHPSYGTPYNPDSILLPPTYRPAHLFDNGEMGVRDEVVVPAPRTPEVVRQELADYYGMISEVDHQIGRLLAALESSGERENTIIVFAGDNGLAMGQHGLMGKQSLYDHSIKVPLTVWADGVPAAASNDGYCYLYDINPTLMEMVGVPAPPSVTGRSLTRALAGGKSLRDGVWLAYSSIQRAMVKDGYKYIIYNVDGGLVEQLFDLKRDPWESRNLLTPASVASAKIATKMREELKREMAASGDFCNLDNYCCPWSCSDSCSPTWWAEPHKVTWTEGMNMYK